ncbi:MAG: AI-2E family transporter [Proteobacteria bacterium]|nr:AI-2E family transporter [Pseudomonadota bacterium]HQR03934.1 AI-2E family transporter [Rhodocyclaceae bacterium]
MNGSRQDRLLAALALIILAIGCVLVLRPFLTAVLWAAILASTAWPGLLALERLLKGRRTLAASLLAVAVTLVLVGPFVIAAMALAGNVTELGNAANALLQNGLPDAPEWVGHLPLVGDSATRYWQQFAHDGDRLAEELAKLAEPARVALLSGGQILGRGLFDLAMSAFLAFFFLLHGEALAGRLAIALERIAGERARNMIALARGTVTGVIYGILGTALAQGVLAGIGFALAGVPGAALLGLATFFLSPLPIGPPLIWGGAALWLFQAGDTGWTLFIVAWGIFVISMVDNFLKPIIISRGAQMPLAVVFLGIFGGAIAFGLIGAFLGPTLLALGYRLLSEWTARSDAQPGS